MLGLDRSIVAAVDLLVATLHACICLRGESSSNTGVVVSFLVLLPHVLLVGGS